MLARRKKLVTKAADGGTDGVRNLAIAIALISSSSARAQKAPPAPPPEVRAAFSEDGTLIHLESRWGKRPGTRLKVGNKKPALIARGATAGTLIVGHGVVVAAVVIDDAKKPFRVRVAGSGKGAAIARPGNRRDIPFAVVGTATDDGFAVFFQEVQADDPSAAHTYLALLDKAGKPAGPAKELAVPWALADAIDNGAGYHLALFYPGDSRGMRLSMVSLTRGGRPQQHPDWASAAGFIADVHLFRDGDKIRAFYRGGSGGERLLESDVTAIGQWGREPAKARDHGALPMSRVIALKKGKPIKVRR